MMPCFTNVILYQQLKQCSRSGSCVVEAIFTMYQNMSLLCFAVTLTYRNQFW